MDVKMGQKTWVDGRTNHSVIEKSDGVKQNSATDLQKLGGQEIGDLLNQVADPNYVDPKKMVRAVGNDKLDKDAFMKLMMAQMKNQDPTNPLKSHEMAAQLAQFTSLEQLQNMNTTLGEIQKGQKPAENFQMLNLIGKTVDGDSAKLSRLRGDKTHDFNFTLPDDAKDITIQVRNELGETVRKVELHNMKKGDNRWIWNGKNESGANATTGEYNFVIEAKASNGKKLAVKTDFKGMISGVSYTAEGPILMVGNQTIKMKDIRRIADPSLNQKDQKSEIKIPQDLKTQQPALDNDDKGAEEPKAGVSGIMENIAMSGGMMEKLKRETDAIAQPANPEMKPALKPETKASPKDSPSANI
jgi:flagellar basal-body rod modification protein FlgD